jgi:hypothetical protein
VEHARNVKIELQLRNAMLREEIDRCEREAQECLIASETNAWAIIGYFDWFHEKELIEKEILKSQPSS